MTQRLDRLNVNAMNFNTPPPRKIYCYVHSLTINYHIGSPFAQNTSGHVNYINYNSRPTNDPFFITYNLGLKELSKFLIQV